MNFVTGLKNLVKRLPGISKIVAHRDRLLESYGFVPPGHYLSPIISIDEYLQDEIKLAAAPPTQMLGIDLNLAGQLDMLQKLSPFWHQSLFTNEPTPANRYYTNNPAFGSSDAFSLHGMIRHFKPKRLIEVGSGLSSCVTLDVNEQHCNNAIELTFIEPYPDLLKRLMRKEDLARHTIMPSRLQDVPLDVFAKLQADDILFIDSTHVSKLNSDVNYLFFEILPRLATGVIVHVHDIFYPFDYPREWVLEGRSWNEAYVLRSFLQYNQKFEIIFFNNYLQTQQAQLFRDALPGLDLNGGSIWLRVN